MEELFESERAPTVSSCQEALATGGSRKDFFARDPQPDWRDHPRPAGREEEEQGDDCLDEEAACRPDPGDEFVTAYQKIAARCDEALAAIQRKFAAPVRRVLYADLQSTLWVLWQVTPDNVTVSHIRHALDLLVRKSAGGVELDRGSCEAGGVDYIRLISLLRRSRLSDEDISAGPKVPRKAAPAMIEPPARESAPAPVAQADPAPDGETGAATVCAPRRKAGRPAQISVDRKEAALKARKNGGSWRDAARILYNSTYPTRQQVRNASNVLSHYTRALAARPDNS